MGQIFPENIVESVRRRNRNTKITNLFLLLTSSIAFISIMVIVGSLALESSIFFNAVPVSEFLTGTEWTVLFAEKKFGVLPLLTATAITSAIALVVAVPAGLATAIYLSEYARPSVRRDRKSVV